MSLPPKNVHCIGVRAFRNVIGDFSLVPYKDRANHLVLDAFEKAINNEASRAEREFVAQSEFSTSRVAHDADYFISQASNRLRLRMEHAQIMTQEDIHRAGRLGSEHSCTHIALSSIPNSNQSLPACNRHMPPRT